MSGTFSRRDALRLGALGAAAPFLWSCSKGSGSGAEGSLQFWDMVWGPPEYIDTAKTTAEMFPDGEVTYRSVPWNNWYQTYTTAIGSGTAPDVSTGAAYQAIQFFDQGAILPLDELVEEMRKSGDLADFPEESIEFLQYQGHQVALPWSLDIRVLHYRKDLFDKAGLAAPTNWEELRSVARELTGADQYGLTGMSDIGGTHYLYFFLLNNGGALFTPDRQPDLLNDRNVEALEYLSELVRSGWVHPGSAGFTNDDALKAFGEGKAAMLIDSPGIASQFPNLPGAISQTKPLAGPHGDKGTVYWINNIMAYNSSENPRGAMDFIRWWSKNQKDVWSKGHSTQLPARTSLAEDPYIQQRADLAATLADWIPVGKTTATQSKQAFPELNEVEGEGVMFTLIQDILQGKDVQQLLPAAQQKLEQIMAGSS